MNVSVILRLTLALLVWAGISVPAALGATAQEATPSGATPGASAAALDVPLIDAAGAAVGLATFSEGADGITLTLSIEGLAAGEHGWHLHAMGVCEPSGQEPFSTAGPHWNPTAQPHGGPDDEQHHAGDFGNLVASEDGLAEVEITTTDFTLGDGPTSVYDEDGTAIVIHEGIDDLVTQPSGDSGARFACGVVAETTMDMAATPAAIGAPVS